MLKFFSFHCVKLRNADARENHRPVELCASSEHAWAAKFFGRCKMTRLRAAVELLLLSALICIALPTSAQTISAVATHPSPLSYDVSKEITLNGSVTSLLAKPEPGMVMGAHLVIATSSGPVDASLGWFALRGKDGLSVSPGQEVAVTGVKRTINNRQVFLARTVKVDGQLFTIRNEHGLLLSPQARERLSRPAGDKEVQP
jgi:hypothetical protein